MFRIKRIHRPAPAPTAAASPALPGLAGCSHFPEPREHQHGADGNAAQLTLNNGKKLATDEPLRQGAEALSQPAPTGGGLVFVQRGLQRTTITDWQLAEKLNARVLSQLESRIGARALRTVDPTQTRP